MVWYVTTCLWFSQYVHTQPDIYSQGGYYGNIPSQPDQSLNYQYQQPTVPVDTPQMQYSIGENLKVAISDNQYSNVCNLQPPDGAQITACDEHLKSTTNVAGNQQIAPPSACSVSNIGDQLATNVNYAPINILGADVVDRAQHFETYDANVVQRVAEKMKDLNVNEGGAEAAVVSQAPLNNAQMDFGAVLSSSPVAAEVLPITPLGNLDMGMDLNLNPQLETQTKYKSEDYEGYTPQNFLQNNQCIKHADCHLTEPEKPHLVDGHNSSNNENGNKIFVSDHDVVMESKVNESVIANDKLPDNSEITSQQLYNRIEVVNNGNSCKQNKSPDRIVRQVEEAENQEVLLNGVVKSTYKDAKVNLQVIYSAFSVLMVLPPPQRQTPPLPSSPGFSF